MKSNVLWLLQLLLAMWLTLLPAGVHAAYARGFLGTTYAEEQQEDQSDLKQIADMLHPPSSEVEVHKDIFSFSPPESEFSDAVVDLPAPGPKTRFKIVFIRSPDPTKELGKSVAQLAKAANEKRTIIYVLQKHNDIKDLANRLAELKKEDPNKPQVHFVKYRTSDEANQAVRTIQSQYDSLGGNTQEYETEVAPVLNLFSKR